MEMTLVKCAECGKEIKISSGNAYDQISKHRQVCKGLKQKRIQAIGMYLSNKVREYDIYE